MDRCQFARMTVQWWLMAKSKRHAKSKGRRNKSPDQRTSIQYRSADLPDRFDRSCERDDRYDLDRIVRLVISIATLVGSIWLLRYLSDVLIPFVVALLLAYLLHPTVTLVERRIGNRSIAVLATVFGLLLACGVALMLLIPFVSSEISAFREAVAQIRSDPVVAEAGIEGGTSPSVSTFPSDNITPDADLTLGERFEVFVNSQTNDQSRWVLEKVREFITREEVNPEEYLLTIGRKLLPGVWGVVTGAVQFVMGLTGLIVLLLYVIFLLNDFRLVEQSWKNLLPPTYRGPLVQFLDEFRHAMSRYFRGQFVIALCMAVMFSVGFSLIGLRMGVLLGIFIGVLNMVPYLQSVGLVPAAMLALLKSVETGSSVVMVLFLTLLVFAVAQLVQDAFLMPRIMGKATGLRPAIILLGVFVWGQLLGFLGVVLAIPLTCLGLAYYRRWVLKQHDAPVMQMDGA